MALFSDWKRKKAERNAALVTALRNQAVVQRRQGDKAVMERGAYPGDNDHYDAAILMIRAADALEAR